MGEYMAKIHEDGKRLFGESYDKQRTERMVRRWVKSGMTESGIWKSIHYWYDIRKNSIDEANGSFGIIPYIYEEAKKWYNDLAKLHRSMESGDTIEKSVNHDVVNIRVNADNRKGDTFLKGFELK